MNVLEVNQVHFYILPSTIITVVIYLTLLYSYHGVNADGNLLI